MYAQVLKSDMRVNLIGGNEEGLPIEHPLVICVDIGKRTDVELYMKYNEKTGEFYHEQPPEPQPPSPEPPTVEDRLMAVEEALLMIL